MFRVGFGLDSASLLWELDDIEHRQLPFVQMLAATQLAQQAKKGMLPVMKARLDRPTPTTLNSLFVKMATKVKPAQVYFKDSWGSGVPADAYLQQAVSGGIRPPQTFRVGADRSQHHAGQRVRGAHHTIHESERQRFVRHHDQDPVEVGCGRDAVGLSGQCQWQRPKQAQGECPSVLLQ